MNRKDLRVEAAAIRTDAGEVFSLPRPARHHDVITLMRSKGYTGTIRGDMQGFVLNDGRFVMRKAALYLALDNGQASKEKCHAPAIGLFSEDVW